MDGGSEGSLTVEDHARRWTNKDVGRRCQRELITINVLPDDVLLEIFDFHVIEDWDPRLVIENQRKEDWKTLAHVCRRWRSLVFQSPRRLNLRLLCTPKTRARDTLDTWPPLPLIIYDSYSIVDDEPSSMDGIIAALERNDRVCQIQLTDITSLQLEYITYSPAMQKPFLELTHLHLGMCEGFEPEPILPDSFLGRTAPRLRSVELTNVPFPELPKLLLSATHLVNLFLHSDCSSGYIPPEEMAPVLSVLNCLEFLYLYFLPPQPRPALASRRPPPFSPTRSTLPSLTEILFQGASGYLEEIMNGIDAPRLNKMFITFVDQIMFNTPHPFQFTSRSPTLRAPEMGWIEFDSHTITVRFLSQTSHYCDDVLRVEIPYTALGWQLSSLKQVCASSLPPVSTLKDLYIHDEDPFQQRHWQHDVENTLWLELLHPFAAVKRLYLCEEFVPRIAPALQELVEGRTTEVLPSLENIFLEGFRPSGLLLEAIEKFIGARRLTNHPVAVSRWDRDRGIMGMEIFYGW